MASKHMTKFEDEDNSLNTVNTLNDKNYQAPSQKFRQIKSKIS